MSIAGPAAAWRSPLARKPVDMLQPGDCGQACRSGCSAMPNWASARATPLSVLNPIVAGAPCPRPAPGRPRAEALGRRTGLLPPAKACGRRRGSQLRGPAARRGPHEGGMSSGPSTAWRPAPANGVIQDGARAADAGVNESSAVNRSDRHRQPRDRPRLFIGRQSGASSAVRPGPASAMPDEAAAWLPVKAGRARAIYPTPPARPVRRGTASARPTGTSGARCPSRRRIRPSHRAGEWSASR